MEHFVTKIFSKYSVERAKILCAYLCTHFYCKIDHQAKNTYKERFSGVPLRLLWFLDMF